MDRLSHVTTVDPKMSTDDTVIGIAIDYITEIPLIMTRRTREYKDGRKENTK